ncbi:serine/threonine-protein kinase [Yinghuangia sp. YIM S09857]|uniref:serine/threonine-protein kinase n=1 Tax=Yinghuangia sp. YIM S09857 TaxID=3436929 RepID=UPI003F52AE8A
MARKGKDPPLPARFAPLREVGRGATGGVWAAHDRVRGHAVAVKLPTGRSAEELQRFAQEGRLITGLRHPNIVRGFDFDATPGGVYLSMEVVQGPTMAEVLEKQGPFTPEQTAFVGAQLASALRTVHEAGWIHRDIDTGNVLIEPGNRPKLIDFGVAAPIDTREPDWAPREYTPGYAAPERVPSELGGMAHGGPATDLYSLGVVMHEMATGRPVFPGRPRRRLARQQRETPPRLSQVVPGVPRELSDVVAQLLSREYARRPQSAQEVLDRLSAVADGPARPAAAPRSQATGKSPGRSPDPPGTTTVTSRPADFPGVIGLTRVDANPVQRPPGPSPAPRTQGQGPGVGQARKSTRDFER